MSCSWRLKSYKLRVNSDRFSFKPYYLRSRALIRGCGCLIYWPKEWAIIQGWVLIRVWALIRGNRVRAVQSRLPDDLRWLCFQGNKWKFWELRSDNIKCQYKMWSPYLSFWPGWSGWSAFTNKEYSPNDRHAHIHSLFFFRRASSIHEKTWK